MVTAVISNSAAGTPHPTDPNLKIPLVALVNSNGAPVSGGSHSYGYTNGLLTTDTWTTDTGVFVKTYIYTSGVLTGESDWVKQ